MADVSIGDTADITLTDSASLTAKVDIDENSLLAKAGFKQMVSHTAAFVAKLDGPVDQSGFKTASFGAKFSAPLQLIAQGMKVTVKAALEQCKATDPSKDRKFMAARAALAGVLGQVTRNSRAAFAGGWGIAVMEQVSGFAAPASLDIAADGGIKQHYESGSQAVQCSA